MRLNSVDLPAPLGPMTACVSPCATSTVTSRTAYTPPNARDTPATLSRSAMGHPLAIVASCVRAQSVGWNAPFLTWLTDMYLTSRPAWSVALYLYLPLG